MAPKVTGTPSPAPTPTPTPTATATQRTLKVLPAGINLASHENGKPVWIEYTATDPYVEIMFTNGLPILDSERGPALGKKIFKWDKETDGKVDGVGQIPSIENGKESLTVDDAMKKASGIKNMKTASVSQLYVYECATKTYQDSCQDFSEKELLKKVNPWLNLFLH